MQDIEHLLISLLPIRCSALMTIFSIVINKTEKHIH